jgi:hypothetical protein
MGAWFLFSEHKSILFNEYMIFDQTPVLVCSLKLSSIGWGHYSTTEPKEYKKELFP